jgi:hypothetical protein
MKRLLLIFTFVSLLAAPQLALVGSAGAVNIFENTCDKYSQKATSQGTNAPSVCQDVGAQQTKNPIIRIIKAAIEVISYVVGIAAVIGILASALRMITANGDSNAIATARTGLIYCLIGVVVVSLSQLIVVFVLDKV